MITTHNTIDDTLFLQSLEQLLEVHAQFTLYNPPVEEEEGEVYQSLQRRFHDAYDLLISDVYKLVTAQPASTPLQPRRAA